MSRELKFRIFDKDVKRFLTEEDVKDFELFLTTNGEVYSQKFGTIHTSYKALQYTGLKDKNGKEIYEGDIINGEIWINDPNGKSGFAKITNRKIYFQSGTFMVDIRDYIDNVYKIEVVGNLYENPELLEQ